jgi:fatty-acyl-CoA synthase
LQSTMQDFPLTVTHILRHGESVYPYSEVITYEGEKPERRASFREVASRSRRLAKALASLGVKPGDRVATFAWNHQEHQEAYLAVPSMGAVLHTLNIRLFPEQLAYVIQHAEDSVILVDASLAPLLARVKDSLGSVRHLISIGQGDTSMLGECLSYDELLDSVDDDFEWPELEERSGAAMCYTSGTTGDPKGVVYSHRSIFLHSFAVVSSAGFRPPLNESDRFLVVVPMFHANAWGLPYAAWMVGGDMVMPKQYLQSEHLARQFSQFEVTAASGVPTIWNDLVRYAEEHDLRFPALRMLVCGGSAVSQALMERCDRVLGVHIIQAWGMTETSPVGTVATPPRNATPETEMHYRTMAGRVQPGVEIRICDPEGNVLPNDGESIGEIEIRGPWITGSYYKNPDPEKFHDGWLRTGDVGTLDEQGFMRITDRTKDVIKSGGEWVSSVDLENAIMGNPEVLEASVIAIPHEKWEERPLACVVRKPGSTLTGKELIDWLEPRVAKWWLPEQVAFVDEIPKTSVGKFDKKVLRAKFAKGELEVEKVRD